MSIFSFICCRDVPIELWDKTFLQGKKNYEYSVIIYATAGFLFLHYFFFTFYYFLVQICEKCCKSLEFKSENVKILHTSITVE